MDCSYLAKHHFPNPTKTDSPMKIPRTLILFTITLLTLAPVRVCGQEPAELTSARLDYEAKVAVPKAKLETAILARGKRYVGDLKLIEDKVAAAGQLDGLILLKAEREAYEQGHRTTGYVAGDAKVPQTARQLRTALDGDVARLRAAVAPDGRQVATAYLQQLGDLERRLTSQKNVAAALVVRHEREELQLSGLNPLNPPTTGLVGDWSTSRKLDVKSVSGNIVTFKRNGTWTSTKGSTGTWEWKDKAKRQLDLHWNDKTWHDTYTLSADGKHMEGKDDQGVGLMMERLP